MLSHADAQLAARDQAIPGLARVLDADALADGLRAALPGQAIPAVEVSYARYKPATSCLVGMRLGGDGVAYAKAYRRGDGDKAAKAVGAARAPGPWGPGAVSLGDEVVVSFFPNDRKLAIGRRLGDAERRRSFLRRVLPSRPDAWEGEVRAVRYKPERRYVARVDGADGPVALLRCYSAGDFRTGAAAAKVFTSGERLRIAELLGVSERHRALALEWLDAGPLPARSEDTAAFTAVGEALAAFHAQSARTLLPLERTEEAALLRPAAAAIAAVAPDLAGDAKAIATEIGAALRRLPPVRLPIHGDFSADQVMFGGGRVAIVDYDAARLGDPASDLGLFRATLLADVLRGALPTAEGERRTIALLDGYRAASGDAGGAIARIETYTSMWLLRLAIEPFRQRLPDWPVRIEAILLRGAVVAPMSILNELRTISELSLRRAWPRGRDHLLLEYATPGGRLVAGQWFADPDRAASVAERTAQGPGGPVRVRGRLVLQAGGADRRLPGLADLLASPGATLVSHRPERRAVVRIGDRARVRYAKIVRPERVAGLVAAAQRASAGPAFSTPRLLHSEPRQGVTIWSTLRGRSLYDLLGSEDLIPAAQAAGRALRAFHALPGDGLTPHTVAREREVVRGWLRHLRAYAPREGEELRPALAVVEELLRDLPPVTAGQIHRDCYDRQIVACEGGGIGMLDFDTLALGDPALDLANLLVHLELRVLQGTCTAERARKASAAVVAGYQPSSDVTTRLPAYAAATRLRLACVYGFRPDQAEVARRLMWWVTSRAA